MNFTRYTSSMVKKWIKYASLLDPITTTAGIWLRNKKNTDALIEHVKNCKMLIDLSHKKTLSKDERVLYEELKTEFNDVVNGAGEINDDIKRDNIIDIAYRE